MKHRKRTIAGLLVLLLLAAAATFYFHPVSCFSHLTYLQEELAGVESHTVELNHMNVHYLVEGPKNGQPIVLVHGLGGSAEDWRRLAPQLTRAGYRVYSPDLPGYGRSDKPAGFSYGVHAEAAVVVDFIDTLHLGTVDLAGWSMGGWIVQILAIDHPNRIRKLILLDAAGLYEPPTWDTNLFMPTTVNELHQLEDLLMPIRPTAPPFVERDILEVSQERAWVIRRALTSMLSGADTTDRLLPELKTPTLIVWGSVDRVFPLSLADRMQGLIPRSELKVAEGCGHMAPRDCARTIGPWMVDFLGR